MLDSGSRRVTHCRRPSEGDGGGGGDGYRVGGGVGRGDGSGRLRGIVGGELFYNPPSPILCPLLDWVNVEAMHVLPLRRRHFQVGAPADASLYRSFR